MIEPTKTYCSDCQREMSGEAPASSASKSFLSLFFLLLILVVAGAYYVLWPEREDGSKLSQRPPKTLNAEKSESALTRPAPVESKPAAEKMENAGGAPSPATAPASVVAPATQTAGATASPVEPTAPLATEAALSTPNPLPIKPVESESGKLAAAQEPSPNLPAAGYSPGQPAAQPPKNEVVIWVFYQKVVDTDRKFAEELKKIGYVNAQPKGRWDGNYRDQNIFYRTDDKKPVQALLAKIPQATFQAYNYKSERIASRIKEHFKKNATLELLVILQ
jgi:hypothetical protein